MARTKRHDGPGASTRPASSKPARGPQEAPHSVTPTMNERLRGHFKWVFALLAIVFALMFVVAGVGTGGPSMLDMLNDGGSAAAPTVQVDTAVKDALAKTKTAPTDAQAWVSLAQAYVNAGETDKVADAAAKAATLAPKDADVQSSLADLYLSVAAASLQQAQTIYADAQGAGLVGGRTTVPQTVIPGQASGIDAFQTAQTALSSASSQAAMAKVTPLQTAADDAYKSAVSAQTVVTDQRPDDPAAWFRLGQISTAANDNAGAITAYAQFVKLAPEDPLVTKVKDEIDRLTKAMALSSNVIPTG